MTRRGGPVPYCAPPPAWWRNGLGWCMFVVGPGCGFAIGLAIASVAWR